MRPSCRSFRATDHFKGYEARASGGSRYVQRRRRWSVGGPAGVEKPGQGVSDVVVLNHLVGYLDNVVDLQGKSETGDYLGAAEIAQVCRNAIGVQSGQQVSDFVTSFPYCERCCGAVPLVDCPVQDGQGDGASFTGSAQSRKWRPSL